VSGKCSDRLLLTYMGRGRFLCCRVSQSVHTVAWHACMGNGPLYVLPSPHAPLFCAPGLGSDAFVSTESRHYFCMHGGGRGPRFMCCRVHTRRACGAPGLVRCERRVGTESVSQSPLCLHAWGNGECREVSVVKLVRRFGSSYVGQAEWVSKPPWAARLGKRVGCQGAVASSAFGGMVVTLCSYCARTLSA